MATSFITRDSILRLPEVKRKVGLGTSAIYVRMAAEKFPLAIPLGGRHVGWSENELDLWIEQQKAKRRVAA